MGFWDYVKSAGKGAAGGSVAGPWGTLAGAVGGIGYQAGKDIGLWGKDKDKDKKKKGYDINKEAASTGNQWTTQFDESAGAVQERQATQVEGADVTSAQVGQTATVDETRANESRAQQMELARLLAARARGEGGPSPAELQMNRGLQTVLAGQKSMAAGATGQNRALAQRTAANAAATAQQDIAGQAALLRAQEQQAAQQQLATLSGQTREQDLGVAKLNAQFEQEGIITDAQLEQQGLLTAAQFEQQARLANQGADLSMQDLNDRYSSYLLSQGFSRDVAIQQAKLGYEALKSGADISQQQIDLGYYGTPSKTERYIGTGLQVAGSMMAAYNSDATVKNKIKPANKEVDNFLNALKSYEYKYKKGRNIVDSEQNNNKKFIGILAQDLLKSKIGKNMVDSSGDTLKVKIPETTSVTLAALARLNDRLKKVEKE